MKNIENLQLKELDFDESVECLGGSDPDGCGGCAAGSAVRDFMLTAPFFIALGFSMSLSTASSMLR